MNWRDHLLCGVAALWICLALGTELLSALHAITPPAILLFWLVAGSGLATWFWRTWPRNTAWEKGPGARHAFLDADRLSKAMALVIYVWLTVTGVVAFLTPPNNWDSMTYHMARVAHWHQDHSIAFFATNMESENQMPPLGEWGMLHIVELTGNDQLCNFIQWFSYAGCIWLVSLMAGLLGLSARGAGFAAFFAATLRINVLESTTTQTDLAVTFWLTCALYACIRIWIAPGRETTFLFAASLALALLTKTVAVLYGFPLGLWFCAGLLRRDIGLAARGIALVAVLCVGLNLGHAVRNYQTSGSLLGPDRDRATGLHFYSNDIHTPGALFSNIERNANLHLVPFASTVLVKRGIYWIDRRLGIDPTDPRTTYDCIQGYIVPYQSDSGSSMQPQFLLILLALATLVFFSRPRQALPWLLAATVVAAALIFCFVLKFQPWISRLHLPAFVWAAPLAAWTVQRPAWRLFLPATVFFMALDTAPDVFHNDTRPAIGGHHALFVPGSHTVRFMQAPEMEAPTETLGQLMEMNHLREVGLKLGIDNWEYTYFDEKDLSRWRVDHMQVDGLYASLETNRVPDVVIASGPDPGPALTVHGRRFSFWKRFHLSGKDDVRFYLPDDTVYRLPAGS